MGLPATMFAAITVKSPNNQISLTIDVQNNTPVYSVAKNGQNVINQSKLGIKFGNDEYYNFNSYNDDGKRDVNDNFTLSHGKRSTYQNHYLEQTVTFRNSGNGRQLTMVFRVYDDAVAFRYTKKDGGNNLVWDNEQSEFNFNGFQRCWVQRAYDAGYSDYYQGRSWNDIQKTTYQGYQYGYCAPMLVQTGNNDSWCLLTESASLSTIAASTIVKGNVNGGVKLEIVKHGNKLGGNAIDSRFSSPFESPWRTIIIGSLAQIVESTATQNLSPATLGGDWSWVKPGRVAWHWAAEDGSHDLTQAISRRYTDMAAHFGWEYNLLDEGWEGRLNIQDEVNYAKARGVDLILWFNQNHFQNDYNSIYNEMKKYADMGVKGFKIDFFEDDRQEQLLKYERMLDAAKQLKLVLNFHGCTKPSGLDRTWPNLLTMEANYGGEMYMFWPQMTPAYHVVNLCLTRNVLGSMDFTPLKWGMSTNSIRSIENNTWAQELAMAVAFESGEFHPSDTPENLQYSVADPLLKMLPVAWDDVKCIEAQPDQYATIARRKGNNWWVATLANDARTATISTDYLDAGKTYYAHIYRDGDYRYEVKSEVRQGITKGTRLTIPVLKYGGAIVIFTTDSKVAYPHDRTYEAEYYNQGGNIENDNRVFGGKFVSNLNANNKVVFTDVVAQRAGQYAVTLYYRANSATKAYVQANDGAKVQMNMVQPGVRANDHPGENIGFRTALVYLNKGLNKLTIANDQGGNAPMVDHITVRPADFPAAQASDILTADGKKFANAQTIEAETGNGDGLVQDDGNCSGGKRLNELTTGKKRTYTINVNEAGVYDFNIFYMSGENRDIEVAANGKTVKILCNNSGSYTGNAIKVATASLHLNAGQNTFTLGNAGGNAPNVDKIDVVLAASDAAGNDGQGDIIEAESGTAKGTAVNNDAKCSGGSYVGNIGNGNTETYNYNAAKAGEYDITVYYMTYAARDMYVQVNNGAKTLQNYAATGSWDGSNIATKTIRVKLNKGNNTIVLGNEEGWSPNVDRLAINLIAAEEEAPVYVTGNTIEAENGLGNNTAVNNDNNCSGGKYVGNIGNGATVSFGYSAAQAGEYDITIHYMTYVGRDMYVQVNNGAKNAQNYAASGSWDGTKIATKTVRVNLNQGNNTIVLGNDNGWAPNVDKIDIAPVEVVVNDNVEAENGTVNNAAVNNDTKCSGGKYVGNIGNGATVTYAYNAPKAGSYDITVYYMTYFDRNMYVQVNNGAKTPETYAATGSWDGTSIGKKTVRVNLNQGNNTIVLGNDNDWAPNVDKLNIVYVGAQSGGNNQGGNTGAANAAIFDWAGYLGVNDSRVKGAEIIQRNGDVYVLAKDLDGVGSSRRVVAVVNKSNQTQQVIVSGQRLGYDKALVIDGQTAKYALNVNVNAGGTNIYTLSGTRQEQTRYEAENAAINDYENNSLTANNRFANVFQQNGDAQHASNGFVVGWLGYFPTANNGQAANSYLQWDNVYSKTGGEYFVTLNYFTGANRGAAVYVNGQKVQEWNNLNTGSYMTAGTQTVKVNLRAGANTIRVTYAGNAGNAQIDMPNIDFIDVVRAFNVSGNLTQTDYYQYGSKVMPYALDAFYNKGTGNDAYQWSNHYTKGDNNRGAVENIWWQGYAMATFAEFAKAARTTGDYNTYNDMIAKMANLYPAFVKDIDGRVCWMMRPGYGHRFSDDDAWASIGLLEAYDLEHKQFYLDQVRMFGEYAWKLWDNKGNGGMYWQDSPEGDTNTFITKNAANNNPTVVIFARLYEITGEKVWLDRAIQTYQWIYDVLLDKNDMQVRDNINVNNNTFNNYKGAYNQGSFINAAVVLYRATGDQKYLDHALACAQRLNNNKFENYNSAQYGNIRIAKADGDMLGRDVIVIARGYEELNKVISDRTYINTIKNTMLNAYAERRDADCGLIKDGWKGNASQNTFEGLIQLGFLEMFARLAVNEDYERQHPVNNSNTTVVEAENTTKAAGVTTNNSAQASNGQFVGFVGGGKSLTFTVDAPVTGTYELVSYYCTNGDRDFTVSVNGNVQTVKGVSTGSFGAETMSPVVTFVNLTQGTNVIVIDAAGNAPNFDKFVITAPATASRVKIDSASDVTGIDSVDRSQTDGDVYFDLQGRSVNRPGKGLYIKNQRKVVVK